MQIRNTLTYLFISLKSGVSPPSPFRVFDTCFAVIDRRGVFPSAIGSCEMASECELPNKRGTSRGGWETVLFIDFVLVGHVLENERLFHFFFF